MTTLLLIAVAAAVLAVAVVAWILWARRRRRVAAASGATAEGLVAERVAERVSERADERAPGSDGDVVASAERPSMRDRLGKARATLASSIAPLRERSASAEDTWTGVTETLIRADMGLAASTDITEAARVRAAAADTDERGSDGVIDALRAELIDRLGGHDRSLTRRSDDGPSVWLFVGVNGTGKTTTIGKLAKRETDAGAAVVLAAGDTFRAAASDQLAMWAERASAHIVRGSPGADPASVVYDAVESAAARGADLVLADTAGRLHTEHNLMAELAKVRRVAEKGAGVVTETLLVLDATTGQNGLAQVRQFTEAVDVTGVVLTKLDGSAKGGIVVAVQSELGVPVKLVGLGEGIADLVPFDETEFVDALFA